jgi:hypothetical protein
MINDGRRQHCSFSFILKLTRNEGQDRGEREAERERKKEEKEV